MKNIFLKCTAFLLLIAFIGNLTIFPSKIEAAELTLLGLPAPGTQVGLSSPFNPLLLRGISLHFDNPFLFDFIVDKGQSGLDKEALKEESSRLIKYFLACLAIPDKEIWVNLSPFEKDRIIPDSLGKTELGKNMLAQDYLLKQLTASLIYPEKALGKEFWDKVYTKARGMYGTAQIPISTFNKVWILADTAKVYTNKDSVFLIKSHLKVVLDEDYVATQINRISTKNISSQIMRELIIPAIENEVNTGKNFATLRQMYHSMILAVWFKKHLKNVLLNQVYSDKSKIKGIDLKENSINETIYQQYLEAYKKGVFNYIKEEKQAGQSIPRKYFSGGIQVPDSAVIVPASSKDIVDFSQSADQNEFLKVETSLPPIYDAAQTHTHTLEIDNDLDPQMLDTLFHPDAPGRTFSDVQEASSYLRDYIRTKNENVYTKILAKSMDRLKRGNKLVLRLPIRLFDGPLSGFDLEELYHLAWDAKFPQKPALAAVISDIDELYIEMTIEKGEDGKIIYNAPDRNISVKSNGFTYFDRDTKRLPNGQDDAVDFIVNGLFGITGIKITLKLPDNARAKELILHGGFESSSAFNWALFCAVNNMTGQRISLGSLFAIFLATANGPLNDATGGQLVPAVLFGNVLMTFWGGEKGPSGNVLHPFKVTTNPLLNEEAINNLEGKIRLGEFNTREEVRLANITKDVWCLLALQTKDEGLVNLYKEKLRAGYRYVDALRSVNIDKMAKAVWKYVELRDTLTNLGVKEAIKVYEGEKAEPYAKRFNEKNFLATHHSFKILKDILTLPSHAYYASIIKKQLTQESLYSKGMPLDLKKEAKENNVGIFPVGAGPKNLVLMGEEKILDKLEIKYNNRFIGPLNEVVKLYKDSYPYNVYVSEADLKSWAWKSQNQALEEDALKKEFLKANPNTVFESDIRSWEREQEIVIPGKLYQPKIGRRPMWVKWKDADGNTLEDVDIYKDASNKDNAQVTKGGIDFSSKNLNIEIDGGKINLAFNSDMLDYLKGGHLNGLQIKILNVSPIASIQTLLAM